MATIAVFSGNAGRDGVTYAEALDQAQVQVFAVDEEEYEEEEDPNKEYMVK